MKIKIKIFSFKILKPNEYICHKNEYDLDQVDVVFCTLYQSFRACSQS